MNRRELFKKNSKPFGVEEPVTMPFTWISTRMHVAARAAKQGRREQTMSAAATTNPPTFE
jgi:hypothetical protein